MAILTSGWRRSVPRSIARDVASEMFTKNTSTFATFFFVPVSMRRFANSSSFSVKYITVSVLKLSTPDYFFSMVAKTGSSLGSIHPPFSVRNVFQGLHCTNNSALGNPDWCGGEMEPYSGFTHVREEDGCFVGPFDQGGFCVFTGIPLRDRLCLSLNDEIRHAGAFLRIERPPLLVGADHFACRDPAETFKCSIPLDHLVILVDNKLRDRRTMENRA